MRAEVHGRGHSHGDSVRDRNRDLVLDRELTALEAEGAGRTLRDELDAEAVDQLRRQFGCFDDHIDLVAVGGRSEPPCNVANRELGDQVVGQRHTHSRIGGKRRGGGDDRAVAKRDREDLGVRGHRDLARQMLGPKGT